MALDRRPLVLDFLPRTLRRSLLNFQKRGVQFGISREGRCLIGDEMGLGKTLQAISIAYYYKAEWPLLIVVPSSMKYPWIDEIEKWLPDIEPHEINLIRSGTDISNIATSKINIMGYGLATLRGSSKLLVDSLEKQKFKVVILDESHYLKNRKANRTKVLHSIAKKAKRILLLSGTPSLARPEELYIQLDIVTPGLFGSFTNFTRRYCEAFMESVHGSRFVYQKWNTRGASNLGELHQLLRKHVMIRRLKKEVLTQLPPKRRQKITFDISDSEYKKELESFKQEFKKQMASRAPNRSELTRLSSLLYRYTGLAKAAPAKQYISDLLDCMDNKCLVFSRHRAVMKALEEVLATKRVQYIRIAGDVPSTVRGEMVRRFQTDKQVRVALLAIEAASFGLTLTAADHVIFAELHYTPGMMLQAEDRAHRIGQQNAVNIHYLVARGTLDEVLWGMVRRKVYVTSSALDGTLQELQAEEGDKEKSRQLSACSAWIQQEDGEDDGEGYLFTQPSGKSIEKDPNQQDLRTFFTTGTFKPSTSSSETLDADVVERSMNNSLIRERFAAKSGSSHVTVIVDDSDDDVSDDDVSDDDVSGLGESGQVSLTGERKSELVQEVANKSVVESEFLHDVDSDRGKHEPGASQHEPGASQHEPGASHVDGSPSAKELDLPHNPAVGLGANIKTDENPIKPQGIKFTKRKDGRVFYSAQKSKVEDLGSARVSKDHCKAESQTDSQVMMGSYISAEDEDDANVKTEAELCETVKEFGTVEKEARTQCNASLLSSLKDLDVPCATFLPRKNGQIECASNIYDWTDDSQLNLTEEEEGCGSKGQHVGSGGDTRLSNADVVEASEAIEVCSGISKTEECPTVGIHADKTTFSAAISDAIAEDGCKLSIEIKSSSEVNEHDSIQTLTGYKNDAKNAEQACDVSPTFANKEQTLPIRSPTFVPSCTDIDATKDSKADDSLEDFEVPKKTVIPFRTVQVDVDVKRKKSNGRKRGRPRRSNGLDCGDWSCSACTFLNVSQLTDCSMCFTPRRKLTETTASESNDTVSSTSKDSPMDTSDTSFDFDDSLLETRASEERIGEDVMPLSQLSNAAILETPDCSFSEQSSVKSDDERDSKERPSWCCGTCTFENHWQMIECSICFTPRRRSKRQVKSEWSTPAVERRRGLSARKSAATKVSTDESPTPSERLNASLKVTETMSAPSVSTPINSLKSAEACHDVTYHSGSPHNDDNSPKSSQCESMPSTSKAIALDHKLPEPSPNLPPRKRLRLEDTDTVSPIHITEFTSGVSDCGTLEGSSPGMESTLSCSVDQSKEESLTYESVKELKAVAEELFSNSDPEDEAFWWEENGCLGSGVQSDKTESSASSSSRDETSGFRKCSEVFSANEYPALSSCHGETSGFHRCSEVFSVNELQSKLQKDSSLKDAEQPAVSSDDWDLLGTSWDDELLDDIVSNSEPGENTAATDAVDSRQDAIDDLADDDDDDDPDSPPEPMKLMFVLSRYMDRVYLYSEDGEPLSINFCMSDVENRNTEDLPAILQLDYNFKQAKRMLSEWKRMGEGKRRLLRKSGVMFTSPLEGYQCARLTNKEVDSRVRHLSKEARMENVRKTAAETGGQVRLVRKHPAKTRKQSRAANGTATCDSEALPNTGAHQSTAPLSTCGAAPNPQSQSTCLQAVNKDGVPLCLFCYGHVTIRGVGTVWDARFCSHDCKMEYQIRASGSSVRRQLFEAEQGVCQLCRLDAHAMFQSVKALPKRDRRAFLKESAYSSLKPQVLNRIITEPKEGQFWEADHIKAVAEGGGECGLDNYRTLCVPCHRKETGDLNRRLKRQRQMEYTAGCKDISAFFEPS